MKSDQSVAPHFLRILTELGQDLTRPELASTPERLDESWKWMLRGASESLEQILADGTFDAPSSGMVSQKNIGFFSLCEHHVIPFFGQVHVAYLPNTRMIGFGKVIQIVAHFSSQLQVQERLTDQIAAALMDALQPLGVAVSIEAQHCCMMMRNPQDQHVRIKTHAYKGDSSCSGFLMKSTNI